MISIKPKSPLPLPGIVDAPTSLVPSGSIPIFVAADQIAYVNVRRPFTAQQKAQAKAERKRWKEEQQCDALSCSSVEFLMS